MADSRDVPVTRFFLRRRTLILGAAALAGGLHALLAVSFAQQATGLASRKAVKLAVPDFAASPADQGQLAQQMKQLIITDLQASGNFIAMDASGVDIDALPPFDAWRSAGIDAVLIGRVQSVSDGRLASKFRLFDVAAQTQLLGQIYYTQPQSWRELAHVISAAIDQRLGGQ